MWVAMRLTGACLALLVLVVGCGPSGDEDDERVGEAASEVVICPKDKTVEGLDVSGYQPDTNWKAVAAAGRKFAFIKATEGTGYVNPYFAQDWKGTKANGILRGAYHFFHPEDDPIAQANHFTKTVGALSYDDLPSVIDLEITGGVGAGTIASRTKTFLKAVEDATGKRPILYTYVSFWSSTMGNPPGFEGYPLWIANYGVNCPNVPGDWKTWPFWQYASSGGISGVNGSNVDHNVFNGTLDELISFATGGAPSLAQVSGNDAISAVNWSADKHAEVFVTDAEGSVLHTKTDKATDTWDDLAPLADGGGCGLAAAIRPPPDGGAHLFSPTGEGATEHVAFSDGAWDAPEEFGGSDLSHLSTLVWPDEHVEVFALAGDGSISHRFSKKDGTFSGWASLFGEGLVTGAAPILWGDGHAEIFATDGDGTAWHDWSGDFPSGWHGWEKLEGKVASRPIPVRWPDGHLEVFAITADGGLAHAKYDTAWSAWKPIGDPIDLVGEPGAIMGSDGPEIVARDSSGQVLHLWWLGKAYGGWSPHLDQRVASDPFAWVRADGRPEIFAIDLSGKLVRSYHDADGWRPWAPIGGDSLAACTGDPEDPTGGSSGVGSSGAGGGAAPKSEAEAALAEDDSGCACRAAGPTHPARGAWAGLALLAGTVALASRRRRRLTASLAALALGTTACGSGDSVSLEMGSETTPGAGGSASTGEEGGAGGGTSSEGAGARGGEGGTGGGDVDACPLGLTCVDQLPFHDERDTTKEGSKLFDVYECKPTADESGPEIIYRIALATPGTLTAAVTDGDGVDIDVHIVTDLEDGKCLARDDVKTSAPVDGAEVYVIADTYVSGGVPQTGAYTIDIDLAP